MVMVILILVVFVLGGFINVIYVNSFDDISIILIFIFILLIYLGGVFYLISLLLEFW